MRRARELPIRFEIVSLPSGLDWNAVVVAFGRGNENRSTANGRVDGEVSVINFNHRVYTGPRVWLVLCASEFDIPDEALGNYVWR